MKTTEQKIKEEIRAQVKSLFEAKPDQVEGALTLLKNTVRSEMGNATELTHVFNSLLTPHGTALLICDTDEDALHVALIAEVLAACGGWRYLNRDAKGWVRNVLLSDPGTQLNRDGLADLCAAKSILAGLRLPEGGSFTARKRWIQAGDGTDGWIDLPPDPDPDISEYKEYHVQKVPNEQIQEGIVALPEIQSIVELKERLKSLDDSSIAELFRLIQKYPEMD